MGRSVGGACVGTGELAIRASTARSVLLYMKTGMTVREACAEAARDLRRLTSGLDPQPDRGIYPFVVIHAVDTRGEHAVVTVGGSKPRDYFLWSESAGDFERRCSDLLVF